MMQISLLLVALAGIIIGEAHPATEQPTIKPNNNQEISHNGQADPNNNNNNKQPLLYVPQQQSYSPEFQYADLALIQPQFPYGAYPGPGGEGQQYPRIQPQIVLYGGGGPGQPFLLQPGGAPPPGNFLVPHQPQQPGPNVILRRQPPVVQHRPLPPPVFVAGYPKPAHIPPIEKDAEEVPTNPANVPPFTPAQNNPGRGHSNPNPNNSNNKPEKIETFNETPSEADVLSEADRFDNNPRTTSGLRPGQRFFILNGQPLFSNYPTFNPQIYSASPFNNPNLKYSDGTPFIFYPPQQVHAEDSPTTVPANIKQQVQDQQASLNQELGNSLFFRSGAFDLNNFMKQPLRGGFKTDFGLGSNNLNNNFELVAQYQDDPGNEAIVIDAQEVPQSDDYSNNSGNSNDSNKDNVEEPEQRGGGESTISQAQPSATALAGPGGVAAAAPRGTAFVGKGGVAVSSPQATAVAGPSRDSEEKPKQEKKRRQ